MRQGRQVAGGSGPCFTKTFVCPRVYLSVPTIQIIAITDKPRRIRVHYFGWDVRWDEDLSEAEFPTRLGPWHSRTPKGPPPPADLEFVLDGLLDVQDGRGQWLQARLLDINAERQMVKVC